MRSPTQTQTIKHIETVEGVAKASQTFITIKWGYVSFLVVQIFFALLYLATTIVLTYRGDVQVIKSSAVATLLALSPTRPQSMGTIENIRDAEAQARQMVVQLIDDHLVIEECSDEQEVTTHPVSETRSEEVIVPLVDTRIATGSSDTTAETERDAGDSVVSDLPLETQVDERSSN